MSLFDFFHKRFGAREPEKSFALGGLDLKLKPYLDFNRGFFIEAGANDGLRFSNTLFFERFQKWRGLLIEPIPRLAEQCRVNRPKCLVENYALVPLGSPEREVPMIYCDMMSVVKGAMKSEQGDAEHVRIGCEVQRIESHELIVPARPLSSILDEHRIRKIDFLSLDVEGYELNALKGLDLEKHNPGWMLVEARFRHEIDGHLESTHEPVAVLSHHDVLYRSRKLRR